MYAQKSPHPGLARMMLQRDVLTYISAEGVLVCVSAKEPYVSAKEPTSLSYDGAEVHIKSISKSNWAKKDRSAGENTFPSRECVDLDTTRSLVENTVPCRNTFSWKEHVPFALS